MSSSDYGYIGEAIQGLFGALYAMNSNFDRAEFGTPKDDRWRSATRHISHAIDDVQHIARDSIREASASGDTVPFGILRTSDRFRDDEGAEYEKVCGSTTCNAVSCDNGIAVNFNYNDAVIPVEAAND